MTKADTIMQKYAGAPTLPAIASKPVRMSPPAQLPITETPQQAETLPLAKQIKTK